MLLPLRIRRIEVSFLILLIQHVVGLPCKYADVGRVPLLILSTRHDQGSYHGCKSILAGALDVVGGASFGACDSELNSPPPTTNIAQNHLR